MMKKYFRALMPPALLLTALLALPIAAQTAKDPDTSAPAGSRQYANGMLQQQIEQTRSRRSDRSYYPSGVLQRELIWAMNGKLPVLERDAEFSPSGVMLREKRWANGEPVSDLELTVSGMRISSKLYTGMGPTRELQVQSFFASGVVATEDRYAAPVGGKQHPIGAQKKFDVSGRLMSERVFDEQGRLLEEKAWNAAGELMPAPSK